MRYPPPSQDEFGSVIGLARTRPRGRKHSRFFSEFVLALAVTATTLSFSALHCEDWVWKCRCMIWIGAIVVRESNHRLLFAASARFVCVGL